MGKSLVGEIVELTWLDAFIEDTVNKPGDVKPVKDGLAVKWGKVVRDEPEGVTLAFEIFEDGQMRWVHTIPRDMIKKIRRLS